jgi:hypothetical protein
LAGTYTLNASACICTAGSSSSMAAAAASSRLQLDTETRIEIEMEEERVRLEWQSQGDRSGSGEVSSASRPAIIRPARRIAAVLSTRVRSLRHDSSPTALTRPMAAQSHGQLTAAGATVAAADCRSLTGP